MAILTKLGAPIVRKLTGDAMLAEIDRLELVGVAVSVDPTHGAGMTWRCPTCRRTFHQSIRPGEYMELTGDHDPAKACAGEVTR